MKIKISFPALLFCLYLAFPLQAINFEQEASWQDMLTLAREQNKILFVDAYATWCGPCKMMDRDVFPDETLSAFFDENFINVKLDMESERGAPFAADYKVTAYPSLFFIAPDGSMLRKNVGAIDAEQLMAIGAYVKDPSSSALAGLEARFDAGERDTAFLKELVFESMNLGEVHAAAAEQFVMGIAPEKIAMEVDYFIILYRLSFLPESPMGEWFSTNFESLMGEFDQYVYEKLSDIIIAHLSEGVEKQETEAYFTSARAYVEKTVANEEIKTALLKGIDDVKKSLE